MNIIQSCAITNTTAKKNRQIKYIVIHYTAGTHSEKGQALAVASMFARGSVGGSADFIVDDVETVQYNGDIRNRFCWSVGGSKYTTMSTSEGGKFYNKCTNANSISIEMCSSKKDRSNLNGAASDWYLTEAVLQNAVKLTKFLMNQYGISADNVIMHHHVTGKLCPQPWTLNQGRLGGWYDFKKRITTKETDNEMIETIDIIINGKCIKADAILKDGGDTYIKLRALENANFAVGYDKETKVRTLDNKITVLPIVVDGKEIGIEALKLHDYNFTNLRPIAAALGYSVEYDPETKSVAIYKKE